MQIICIMKNPPSVFNINYVEEKNLPPKSISLAWLLFQAENNQSSEAQEDALAFSGMFWKNIFL